jgi:hypothetical protein
MICADRSGEPTIKQRYPAKKRPTKMALEVLQSNQPGVSDIDNLPTNHLIVYAELILHPIAITIAITS